MENVIIFGKGNMYLRKKEFIFREFSVECFLDNNVVDKEIDDETGLYIYNPRFVKMFENELIIVMSNAVGDMAQQLVELGVSAERIIFGPEVKPYNSFEKMLFSNGDGKIVWDGSDVLYQNEKFGILIRTNASNFEEINEEIKRTPLFSRCDNLINQIELVPIDDTYGINRGMPVDRYYIESFLKENEQFIQGRILEIGDRRYTNLFGNNIIESKVLHVEYEDSSKGIIKANLETGEGIIEESVDCFICTQTLQFIYDTRKAVKNILKLLKPGGIALITVSGISQMIRYERIKYGHFWSFTDMSLRRVFEEAGGIENIDIRVYGNVKTAMSFLYGISIEELRKEDLNYLDKDYQVIIGASIRKK